MNATQATCVRVEGVPSPFSPEFDHVYLIDRAGTITDDAPDSLYAPSVEHDDTHDILIDGGPTRARSNGSFDVNSGWDALTSHTGQHGYNGAVMHASELWSPCHVEDLKRLADDDTFAHVAFTVVAVEAPCTTDEPCFPDAPAHCQESGCDAAPAGWAVLYRGIPA